MGLLFHPFQERHNAKTVGEIKQFVSQLPHMQAARGSLANHTSIAELIKDVTSEYPVEGRFSSGADLRTPGSLAL